jgi:2-octaprenyl-6-methoxyphenol hydroxylase
MGNPVVHRSADIPVCDIAIVGGGLVGCSLFLALQNCGLRVTLIEASASVATSESAQDARHLALNAKSVATLKSLGILLDIQDSSAILQVRINRANEFGRVDLIAAEHGLANFGQLIPAHQLGAALQLALKHACEKNSMMQRIQPAKLSALQFDENGAQLSLSGEFSDLQTETTLHAQLVIGADGTSSAVQALAGLGAQSKHRDYRQSALVFNFSSDLRLAGLALERFTDTGPLAVLPLPNRRFGAVWTLPNEQATALQAAPDALKPAFQHALGSSFGRVSRLSAPVIWPLKLMQCVPNVGNRVALIGNAAQTIHPLGAQGFNLGLRDAIEMAAYLRKLSDQTTCARQASQPDFFADFAAQRALDRQNTIAFSDGLLAGTQSQTALARTLRGAGLLALASNPLLQQGVIRFGLGFTRTF